MLLGCDPLSSSLQIMHNGKSVLKSYQSSAWNYVKILSFY